MTELGKLGQTLIQEQIISNMPPANAPSTVKQKGFSLTLVHTGRMFDAVTYVVKT